MIFNVSGGGGTALNFRVVGGTTAPTNPAENCIWVNTDTPITSWIFSAEEPSPAEPGMVWFSVGTASPMEFNALKKNGIQVYPLSAKQYVDGAFVDKPAQSYQGGEWDEWWDGTIYNYGDLFEHLTGGWEEYSNSSITPTITYADEYIEIKATGSSGKMAAANIVNTFDLTNVTSITAEMETNKYNRCSLYVKHATTGVMSYVRTTANNTKNTVELDTSALSGEHIILGRIDWSEDGTFWMRFYNIKLNRG